MSLKKIRIITDPIENKEGILYEADNILDFLKSYFGTWPETARIYSGNEVALENDITPTLGDEYAIDKIEEECIVTVVIYPAGGVALFVVSLVVSVALAYLLRPEIPDLQVPGQTTDSPNNSLGNRENKPRAKQRIPDIFGLVRAYPDLISVPYKRYVNFEEIEYTQFCLGRGYYLIDENTIVEGDTPINQIPGYALQVYYPYTDFANATPQIQIGDTITEQPYFARQVRSIKNQPLFLPSESIITIDGGNYLLSFKIYGVSHNTFRVRTTSMEGTNEIGVGEKIGSDIGDYCNIDLGGNTVSSGSRDATFSMNVILQDSSATHQILFQDEEDYSRFRVGDTIYLAQGGSVGNWNINDPPGVGQGSGVHFWDDPLGSSNRFFQWGSDATLDGTNTNWTFTPPIGYTITAITPQGLTIDTTTHPQGSSVWAVYSSGAYGFPRDASGNAVPLSLNNVTVRVTGAAINLDLSGTYNVINKIDNYTLELGWNTDIPQSPASNDSLLLDQVSNLPYYANQIYSEANFVSGGDPIAVDLGNVKFSTDTSKLLLNLVAPSGLYRNKNGDKSAITLTINVLLEDINTSAVSTYQHQITGSVDYTNNIKWSIEQEPVAAGEYNLKIKIDPDSISETPDNTVDYRDLRVDSGYILDTVKTGTYGNTTTIYTKITAGPTSVGSKSRLLSMKAQRRLVTDWSDEQGSLQDSIRGDHIINAMAIDPKIGRMQTSEVDTSDMASVMSEIQTYFSDSTMYNFGYTFDKYDTSSEEMISSVAEAIFCTAYRLNTKLTLHFERTLYQNGTTGVSDAALLFGSHNTIPNTEVHSFTLGVDNDNDGLTIQYINNENKDSEEDYTITDNPSGEANNPQVIKMPGVRHWRQAYVHAHRKWNRKRLVHEHVEFEGSNASYILKRNDFIHMAVPGVSVSDPDYKRRTLDGRVLSSETVTRLNDADLTAWTSFENVTITDQGSGVYRIDFDTATGLAWLRWQFLMNGAERYCSRLRARLVAGSVDQSLWNYIGLWAFPSGRLDRFQMEDLTSSWQEIDLFILGESIDDEGEILFRGDANTTPFSIEVELVQVEESSYPNKFITGSGANVSEYQMRLSPNVPEGTGSLFVQASNGDTQELTGTFTDFESDSVFVPNETVEALNLDDNAAMPASFVVNEIGTSFEGLETYRVLEIDSDNAIVFKIKAEEYVAEVYSNDNDDPGEGPNAEGGIPGGGAVPLPG
jgi:hypothetical protein